MATKNLQLHCLPAAQRRLWNELGETSLTILDALAAAINIYGRQFNPLLSLKAIGDLQAPELTKLPPRVKRVLRELVAEVDLKMLAKDLKKRKLNRRCRLSPISQPSR
jgi:hypothetical protein